MTPDQAHQINLKSGFRDDPAQRRAIELLTELHAALAAAQAPGVDGFAGRIGRLASGIAGRLGLGRDTSDPIRGLYLWGDVGRGKTYMMDLFYDCLPVGKQRLHFHRFMHRVHGELTALKGTPDPLQAVARGFAREARVLCFDEFFVSDIGDAMILAELLDGLFAHGVTLVATSNVEPTHLYENGLQRSRFLPAIALLERHTTVLNIDGEIDYRLRALRQHAIYRTATIDDDEIRSELAQIADAQIVENDRLVINGREIEARFRSEGIVAFEFSAICDGPRSAADYIEIAREFHTVIVNAIPVLTTHSESQARRFISLIDEFYDRGVNVVFIAAADIDELYQGQLLSKEFERTRSRVVQMQSDDYLSRPHRP